MHIGAGAGDANFKAEQQPVMCDFEFIAHATIPSRFFVTLLLEMENSRQAEGALSFGLSTVSEFEYRPEDKAVPLPAEDAERNRQLVDALSIAIGTARGYLSLYLSHTYYQRYVLPVVDAYALVIKKYQGVALPSVGDASESVAKAPEIPKIARKKRGSKPDGPTNEL